MDATAKAYLEVLGFSRKNAFALYNSPKLRKELSELNYDLYSGKVDHPHNVDPKASVKREPDRYGILAGFYSKDLADSLSGAVYHIWVREQGFTDEFEVKLPSIDKEDFYNEELYIDDGFYADLNEVSHDGSVEDEIQKFYDSLV